MMTREHSDDRLQVRASRELRFFFREYGFGIVWWFGCPVGASVPPAPPHALLSPHKPLRPAGSRLGSPQLCQAKPPVAAVKATATTLQSSDSTCRPHEGGKSEWSQMHVRNRAPCTL